MEVYQPRGEETDEKKREKERDMAKKRKLVKRERERDIEAPGMGESIWQGLGQLPALQIVTLIQNKVQRQKTNKHRGYPEGRKDGRHKQNQKRV